MRKSLQKELTDLPLSHTKLQELQNVSNKKDKMVIIIMWNQSDLYQCLILKNYACK